MLQSAARQIQPNPPQMGDQVKRAAKGLHTALARMEAALDARQAVQPAPPMAPDAEDLLNQCVALEEENKQLRVELQSMRERHAEVSEQVRDISGKLDALIVKISQILS